MNFGFELFEFGVFAFWVGMCERVWEFVRGCVCAVCHGQACCVVVMFVLLLFLLCFVVVVACGAATEKVFGTWCNESAHIKWQFLATVNE